MRCLTPRRRAISARKKYGVAEMMTSSGDAISLYHERMRFSRLSQNLTTYSSMFLKRRYGQRIISTARTMDIRCMALMSATTMMTGR